MREFNKFEVFLLDLDGLLVDTETIHYNAYCILFNEYEYSLTWDMHEYFRHAHGCNDLGQALYQAFPEIFLKEPCWQKLRARKQAIYRHLLKQMTIKLMPGAEALLLDLWRAQKKRCVVTNSDQEDVALIRRQLSVLDTIPHWVTREQYQQPKPAPDAYLQAIDLLQVSKDHVIGFEDSNRGVVALKRAGIQPVLIANRNQLLDDNNFADVCYFQSLGEVNLSGLDLTS